MNIDKIIKTLNENGYEASYDNLYKDGESRPAIFVKQNAIIAVVFYLDVYENESDDFIANDIISKFGECDAPQFSNYTFINDWEAISSTLRLCVRSHKDREGDATMVEVKNDYEVYFRMFFENYTIAVTEKMREAWGKTFEEVKASALKNNSDSLVVKDFYGMTIVTNKEGLYGASAIEDIDFLSFVSNCYFDSGNFYIIPSSVHELILIPCKGCPPVEHLKNMVSQVNDAYVEDKDKLSYSVYKFVSNLKEVIVFE